mgnify:CR=1 FL=1
MEKIKENKEKNRGYLQRATQEEKHRIAVMGGSTRSDKKKLAARKRAIAYRHNWRMNDDGCPTDAWIGLIQRFSNNPKELCDLFKALLNDAYLKDENKIKLIVASCEEQDLKDEYSDEFTDDYGEWK